MNLPCHKSCERAFLRASPCLPRGRSVKGGLFITSTLAGCLVHLPVFPVVKDPQGTKFHSCSWSPILCLKPVTGHSSWCLTERSCAVVEIRSLQSALREDRAAGHHLLHSSSLGDRGLLWSSFWALDVITPHGLTEKARIRHHYSFSWQTSVCGNSVTRRTVQVAFGCGQDVG